MRDGRIEYLIRLVEKSGITELEISEGFGRRIRISKATQAGSAQTFVPAASAEMTPTPATPPATESTQPTAEAHEDESLVKIVAPMVGTFYRASSPETPPFVDVGSQVRPGETICIIEAMKIMNEIASEVKGSVRKVLVENAQPVEFGQTLFLIEKSS